MFTLAIRLGERAESDAALSRRDFKVCCSRSGCCQRLDVSPLGEQSVSAEDKAIVEELGISVVDCSWAKLDDVPFAKIRGKYERLCKDGCALANLIDMGRL